MKIITPTGLNFDLCSPIPVVFCGPKSRHFINPSGRAQHLPEGFSCILFIPSFELCNLIVYTWKTYPEEIVISKLPWYIRCISYPCLIQNITTKSFLQDRKYFWNGDCCWYISSFDITEMSASHTHRQIGITLTTNCSDTLWN